MRWIVAVPVLVALAMTLTGPVLAQELRIFENIQQGPPPAVIGGRPPATLEIPPAQPLDDRGVR